MYPLRSWAFLPKIVGLTGFGRSRSQTARGLPRFALSRFVEGGCLLYPGVVGCPGRTPPALPQAFGDLLSGPAIAVSATRFGAFTISGP
jgi:hypothetical protein